MKILNVGIIGCGNIAPAYFRGCAQYPVLRVTACADIFPEAAAKRAAEYNVRALSIEELLADKEIDIVINLTIPAAHAEVSRRAIQAGKHVYVEKPLALDATDGRAVLEEAKKAGVRVGCAPDTVLGQGVQSCRKLIDDGAIGTPTGASAFMVGGGPEKWHPSPAFFYRVGGGPLFDMGPYYLTAFATLLGPFQSVTAVTTAVFEKRPSTHAGLLDVETPTHITGLLQFKSGVVASTTFSFDAFGGTRSPNIEIYGTEGTLVVPDPNCFDGEILLRKTGSKEWEPVTPTHEHVGTRGIGVADMAEAILAGGEHKASGALALHVLEAMEAYLCSGQEHASVAIESQCARPAAMPTEQRATAVAV